MIFAEQLRLHWSGRFWLPAPLSLTSLPSPTPGRWPQSTGCLPSLAWAALSVGFLPITYQLCELGHSWDFLRVSYLVCSRHPISEGCKGKFDFLISQRRNWRLARLPAHQTATLPAEARPRAQTSPLSPFHATALEFPVHTEQFQAKLLFKNQLSRCHLWFFFFSSFSYWIHVTCEFF